MYAPGWGLWHHTVHSYNVSSFYLPSTDRGGAVEPPTSHLAPHVALVSWLHIELMCYRASRTGMLDPLRHLCDSVILSCLTAFASTPICKYCVSHHGLVVPFNMAFTGTDGLMLLWDLRHMMTGPGVAGGSPGLCQPVARFSLASVPQGQAVLKIAYSSSPHPNMAAFCTLQPVRVHGLHKQALPFYSSYLCIKGLRPVALLLCTGCCVHCGLDAAGSASVHSCRVLFA